MDGRDNQFLILFLVEVLANWGTHLAHPLHSGVKVDQESPIKFFEMQFNKSITEKLNFKCMYSECCLKYKSKTVSESTLAETSCLSRFLQNLNTVNTNMQKHQIGYNSSNLYFFAKNYWWSVHHRV